VEDVNLVVLVHKIKCEEFDVESNVDEIYVVISVSKTHNKKNINKTVEESIEDIDEINKLVEKNKIKVNVGLATTFGCPFEGLYEVGKVSNIIKSLREKGLNSFILSDTTGMANPSQITSFVETVKR